MSYFRRMLRLGLLGNSQGGGSYVFVNAEAETLCNSFATPATDARKALIDGWFTAIKAASMLADFDLVYGFAAADQDAALKNWVAPAGSYNAVAVNSPAFTADGGYTGDGSTSYLRTNFTPSTAGGQFAQNSAHLWALTDGLSSAGTYPSWAYNGTDMTLVVPYSSFGAPGPRGRLNTGSNANYGSSANGNFAFSLDRSASTLTTGYRDGASVATNADASTANTNGELTLLRSGSFYSPGRVRFATAGKSLGATKQLALYNAVSAYIAGL